MRRDSPRSIRLSARHLRRLLVASFGLTVMSFLAATIVASIITHGIAQEASRIRTDTVPAVRHASRARGQLRQMERLLDDTTSRVASGHELGTLPSRIELAEVALRQEWEDYRKSAIGPGEQQLGADVQEEIAHMVADVHQFLQRAAAHDATGASAMILREIRPAADRVDDGMRLATELTGDQAVEVGTQVIARERSARFWLALLDSLSVLFAALAAFSVIRVVRDHAAVVASRIAETEQFAGRVAHDIRSPLASVGLALELGRRNAAIDAKTRAMLERGVRTLQRVGQLVDGLLVFARAGVAPEKGASARAWEVVDDVVGALMPAAQEKEIDLRAVPLDQCTVACHPGVLASIVSHLVGNAIKYMGDAAVRRVDVRLRDAGTMARLEVQDTGPGVPPEMQAHLFEPFGARREGVAAFSLGLPIVRRLAEGHRGSAGVVSEPGTGSLFWVELPKVP